VLVDRLTRGEVVEGVAGAVVAAGALPAPLGVVGIRVERSAAAALPALGALAARAAVLLLVGAERALAEQVVARAGVTVEALLCQAVEQGVVAQVAGVAPAPARR
jgi:hypothetical protein